MQKMTAFQNMPCCVLTYEAIDLAQNRPLWGLISLRLVLRAHSGACQK